ncbi:MAG: T9SS type A sorting domain-containing protein, partial [Sediminibacterium sp.]|nr:T9SS type A sorting domain-containing protein [Sediminibacterium sp.]
VSPLTNSTYTVSGTSAAGCVSSGFVTSSVTVNALPVISVNSGSICSGSAFTIVPTGASTYTIQGGNNVVGPLTNSTYTVSGTSAAGCVSSGFVTSSVTVNALPVISVNSGSICSGNTFTIVPTGASTYTIQGGNNVVSPLTNSTYTVSGTSTAGCVSSGFVTSSVTVSVLPVITIQSTQSLLCVGQSATLSATGATSYTWNPSIPLNGSISPSVTSSYTVNGTNVSGCSNSAVFTQSVSLCTSVSQRINTEERFRILPNPSAGIFTLEAPPDTKIELRDVLGKILLETVMLSDQLTLNITDQPSGIYFLSIQQNGRVKVIRLIKS